MSFLKGIHPFDHYPFIAADDGEPDDAHGNRDGALAEIPTPRKAIAFYPEGNSQNREPVSSEHVARYVSHLTMLVENPDLFGDQDEVEIGGTRYEIDGDPAEGDWRKGPFGRVNRLFGGEIHLKRVG